MPCRPSVAPSVGRSVHALTGAGPGAMRVAPATAHRRRRAGLAVRRGGRTDRAPRIRRSSSRCRRHPWSRRPFRPSSDRSRPLMPRHRECGSVPPLSPSVIPRSPWRGAGVPAAAGERGVASVGGARPRAWPGPRRRGRRRSTRSRFPRSSPPGPRSSPPGPRSSPPGPRSSPPRPRSSPAGWTCPDLPGRLRARPVGAADARAAATDHRGAGAAALVPPQREAPDRPELATPAASGRG